MLRKTKTLSAFAAALLASATIAQPAAAQRNDTWYAQGGYNDNAPYANDPYYQGYGQDPYANQGYGQDPYANQGANQGYGYDSQYGGAYGEGAYGSYDYEAAQRERAAEAWREGYRSGATQQGGYPYPQQGYGYQPRYDYSASYYDYDAYRRECERQRANNQVGGLIVGAIAGGIFGNAVAGRGSRGAGTAIGAITGGAIGATLASNLDCDDRYYAQRAYYGGFESGYAHRTYRWRNPRSGNYGAFRVGDYYRGPRGDRCATYSQTIWVRGRPEEARGYACRRPDGTWELLS